MTEHEPRGATAAEGPDQTSAQPTAPSVAAAEQSTARIPVTPAAAETDRGANPGPAGGADHRDGPPPTAAEGGTDIGTASVDQHAEKVAAWRKKSDQRSKPKRPFWVELPLLILIAFGLTFLIQTFIAKVYYVPSGSMEKTLHGAPTGGDRILANKVVYDFRDPRRGDVVVFSGPETWTPEASIPGPSNWVGKAAQALGSVIGIAPPNEKDFVKRVIAVGGETVACCDATGNVTINGQPLNENGYIYEPIDFIPGQLDCTTEQESRRCFGPVTVPDGQLWLMGDHRSNSADSSWGCQGLAPTSGAECQGPVPVGNVIGKAVFIVMPPSRWGTIGNPDPGPHQAGLSAGVTTALPVSGGLVGVVLLRGGCALLPGRRRRRRQLRAGRRAAGTGVSGAGPGGPS